MPIDNRSKAEWRSFLSLMSSEDRDDIVDSANSTLAIFRRTKEQVLWYQSDKGLGKHNAFYAHIPPLPELCSLSIHVNRI